MKFRTLAASAALSATMFAGGTAVLTSGTAHAATVTCKTTVTHHHSVTSKGTVSDYTLRKYACGKNYTETETGTTHSASGASSSFTWTKVMNSPCWVKNETRVSVSAKGTVTTTTTHSGNC